MPEELELKKVTRVELCSKGSLCSPGNVVPEALFDQRDKSVPVAPLEERSEVTTGLHDGVPFSTLKFSPAYIDDRQRYICQVTTDTKDSYLKNSLYYKASF